MSNATSIQSYFHLGLSTPAHIQEMSVTAVKALVPHMKADDTTIIVLYVERDGSVGKVQARIEPRWFVVLKLLWSYVFGKASVWGWR